MEHLPFEVRDGTLITAILESDDVVHAIQRKLRILYPELTVPSSNIRQILRDEILCQELLSNERLPSARTQLATANVTPANKRPKSTATTRSAIALTDGEEPLWDILWYDMTYASCGG